MYMLMRDEGRKKQATEQSTHVHVHACVHVHVGRALCLEYRVSWVRVPPEAAHFF